MSIKQQQHQRQQRQARDTTHRFRLYIGNGNWVNLSQETTNDLNEIYKNGVPARYELAPGLVLDILPHDVDCNSKNTDLPRLMRVDLCYTKDEASTQQALSRYVKEVLESQGIIDAFPPTKSPNDPLPPVTSLPTHRHLSMVPTSLCLARRASRSSSSTSRSKDDDLLLPNCPPIPLPPRPSATTSTTTTTTGSRKSKKKSSHRGSRDQKRKRVKKLQQQKVVDPDPEEEEEEEVEAEAEEMPPHHHETEGTGWGNYQKYSPLFCYPLDDPRYPPSDQLNTLLSHDLDDLLPSHQQHHPSSSTSLWHQSSATTPSSSSTTPRDPNTALWPPGSDNMVGFASYAFDPHDRARVAAAAAVAAADLHAIMNGNPFSPDSSSHFGMTPSATDYEANTSTTTTTTPYATRQQDMKLSSPSIQHQHSDI